MAINKILLVNSTYVTENSIINTNVEPQLINRSIVDSQTIHIQETLGTNLYKAIESKIGDGNISEPQNQNYKTLLTEYIQPALLQWTVYEIIPFLKYKLMNKSVQIQTSENSTPADAQELTLFRAELKNKAEFYTQRLKDYICANISKFPEYNTTTSTSDMLPNKTTYSSGFVFDKYYNNLGFEENSK